MPAEGRAVEIGVLIPTGNTQEPAGRLASKNANIKTNAPDSQAEHESIEDTVLRFLCFIIEACPYTVNRFEIV